MIECPDEGCPHYGTPHSHPSDAPKRELDTSELGPIRCGGKESRRCVAHGKQVLLDDLHLADATSDVAAAVIADAVQYAGLAAVRMPEDASRRLTEFLA